jgi:transcriptional regulator with XRE-family HTH domain
MSRGMKVVTVSNPLQPDLGVALRSARQQVGLSLSGMALRTGYSRSYLGNVENGVRQVTPKLARAYERVVGERMNRRVLLLGAASTVVVTALPDAGAAAPGAPPAAPDVAADFVRDIAAGRGKLLSQVQTSHATDRMISALVAGDSPCVASLAGWMRKGNPFLRVNSAGILAKMGVPALDNDVLRALKVDAEARQLYLTAVANRVLGLPWDDAGRLAAGTGPLADERHLDAFAAEVGNPYDSGARWCSVVMLARTRPDARDRVDAALAAAVRAERSPENLRAIAGTLAGIDPLSV